MKSPSCLLAAAILLISPAAAEIIGVEQFDYPDGAIAGRNGGTFWNYKNTVPTGYSGAASTWDALIATPQVTAGRLVTSGNAAAKREYRGATETEGAVNDLNNAKKVFYRVSVTTGPSVTPADYFGISSMDFGSEKLYFGKRGGSTTWGVEEVGVGGTNGSVAFTIQPNTTYTLVVQVDFANDFIRLFVNPDLNGPELGIGSAAASRDYFGTNWSTAVRFAAGTAVTWDDLVIATNWDDLGTVVTTTADEDNGNLGGSVSLREAVKYSPTGSLITFRDTLSGQIITLTHAGGDMEIPGALTIDASALPGGLTVSGNNTSRHFFVASGKSLTLRGLTLTGGNDSVGGGAINVHGTLDLHRCNLTGNTSATEGGAIYSTGILRATDCTFSENAAANFGGAIIMFSGTAELTRCTLSGNMAGSGGGIWHQPAGTTTLSHCTVVGNRATGGFSGGIVAFGTLNLLHCTISQNTGNGGGGLFLQSPATVNVTTSIIAGNTDPSGNRADILFVNNGATLNASGSNLIGSNESVTTQFPAGPLVGTAAAPVDPKLSPLGHFGGPVQTLHPLIGSPAIDAIVTINPGGTDARGFARFVNGDGDALTLLDIGAVEAGNVRTVTTAVDEDNGTGSLSLREALAVSTAPGDRIRFSPSLFSGTILLGSQLTIPTTANGLFIDASNLTTPATISGNSAHRVFNIPATATLAMHSLKIENGKAPNGSSGSAGENGGGIFNLGSLSLFSCTVSGNAAGNGGFTFSAGGNGGSGGGIFSSGPLTLTACTLSGNTSGTGGDGIAGNNGGDGGDGGGIFSRGPLSLTACTLSGNATGGGGGSFSIGGHGGSGGNGGGIAKNDTTSYRLNSCTVASNRTGSGAPGSLSIGLSGAGGGIYAGRAILQNCLFSENTRAPSVPSDVDASITYIGANVLSTLASNPAIGPAPIINPSTLLAPLGDYGGPSQTMALRPGSPARNAGSSTARTADQRGFPLVGLPDIGAYEAGTLSHGNLPVILAETIDFDGDGQSNEGEIIAGTIVTDPTSVLRVTTLTPSGGNLEISFPSVTGKTYTLWRSDTLTGSWMNTGLTAISGNGSVQQFTIPAPVIGVPKRFFRVQVSQ